MSPQLVRRDEIVFLNNNQEEVELYALSDFKAVKKGEDYTQNYLQNQNRALNDINLNQIIIGILNKLETNSD